MQDSLRTARFGLNLGLYGFLALGLALSAGCDDGTAPPADMGVGGEGGNPMGGMGGMPMGGMGGEGGVVGQECLGEDECPTGQYCDIEDGAFSGECRDGCNDDDDCGNGEECNTETHVCGEPPCDGDSDCPEGRCDENGACVDSECSTIRPCEADAAGQPQQCNEDDGTCAPLYACCAGENECSMALDGQCPEGSEQLDPGVTCDDSPCGGSCTPETQGADCAMNEFCNADTNRCQEGCRLEAGSCPEGESCDPETRDCAPRPCVGMDDCESYQFCDEVGNICSDGCRSNDDCPRDGEVCDAGQCVERCDPNEVGACGEGQYCDVVTENCRENCVEHADCENNEACNPVNNQCEESECRDDLGEGGEPNNDEATATVIELGAADAQGFRNGAADGRVLCGDDVDVFQVTLAQAERMRVRLIFDENDDLNFRLSGAEVGDDPIVVATAQSPEETFFPALNDIRNEATYFITVYPGRAVREGVNYRVEISVSPVDGDGCFPDGLEQDDDPENANAIGNANPYEARDLNICLAGDEDWFAVNLTLNAGLRVEVITDGNEPAMTLALFSQGRIDGVGGGGPEYDQVVAEDRAGRTAYVIDIPAGMGAFSDGVWYIRVRSSDREATSAYEINVRRANGGECDDDGYEDNDDVLGGTDLAAIDGVGANGEVPYTDERVEVPSPDDSPLQICTFDDDYYCLDLEAGDRLEAWAQGPVAGEVRVRIVDSDGRNVGAEGLLVGDEGEPIPAELLGALEGRHCVVVDGQGAAQGAYRFWVRRVAVANLCQQDPELVDGVNNTADTATALIDIEPNAAPNRRFEYRNALICGNEDDWYEFQVAERRSRVCVMVDGFRHDNADIDIELFRATGGAGEACDRTADCDAGTHCIDRVCRASIEASEGNIDSEQISVSKRIIGNNNGEYKLRVFRGAAGDDSAYRVLATVTPEDEVCGPDWQERGGANDNEAQATDLGQGQASICDTWLCHDGDEDNYTFIVPAGEDRTVFIEYANQDDGRVFMDLTGPELDGDPDFGGFRRSGDPQGDHQCINIKGGAEAQTVNVRLFANLELPDGDDRVDYTLLVVPTNLDGLNADNPEARFEQGECVNLGGGDLGSCPFGDPFADGCWPHMTLE